MKQKVYLTFNRNQVIKKKKKPLRDTVPNNEIREMCQMRENLLPQQEI